MQPGEEGKLHVFSQKHNKWHDFKFDKVFGEGSTQDEVYAETQPLIRSVLDGALLLLLHGLAAVAAACVCLAMCGASSLGASKNKSRMWLLLCI
jgi:hypothetical protein